MEYQLPKEFATKWVAALRSGEYQQTKGFFKDNESGIDCYCSNGLAYVSNGYQIFNYDQVNVGGYVGSIWNSIGKLPVKPNLVDAIIQLNDYDCLTFPEIADWIEANVEFVEEAAA
jgi:hypothetical protein